MAGAKKDNPVTFLSKHISIVIERSPSDVYNFASRPENMPKWAAGLSGSMRKEGNDWISESPMGKVKVRFAEENNFGVIDHDVTLENGKTFHNPLRVIKNNQGAEVVFTLFRQPEMTDQEYNRDAEMVSKDLAKLKSILEGSSK
jgi:hypothetical protein